MTKSEDTGILECEAECQTIQPYIGQGLTCQGFGQPRINQIIVWIWLSDDSDVYMWYNYSIWFSQ